MKKKSLLLLSSLFCLLLSPCKFNGVNASGIVSDLNELVEKYSHNLVYKKDTTIFLNDSSKFELSSIFHAKNDMLKRTTYYSHDELWMTNELGKYSYYGTDEKGNLTNAIVNYVGETSNNIAIEGVSMEEHYYTLKDIIATEEHNWNLIDGVYSSNHSEVLAWFKGFTAPCYLGANEETSNYILFDRAEIEETSDGLELRLIADKLDQGKLTTENNVFSKAVITYEHKDDVGEVIKVQTGDEDGLIKHRCLECGEEYEKVLYAIGGTEVDIYPSLSNADIVNFQGNIYTYGGSPDGWNRITNVYCFNTYSNKLYKLDVNIANPTTSHRAVLYNEKVYIFGGLSKEAKFNTIQIHDLKNRTLTTSEISLPFGANCFQVGKYYNKAYFIGGSLQNGKTTQIYEIDLDSLEVKELDARLPEPIFKGGWCYFDEYAYVIGGTMGNRVDTIYRFNMRTHKVETMNAKFPYCLSQCRVVYDGNEQLYIFGGTNESGELIKDVFIYNIKTDTLVECDFDLPLPLANTCVTNVNGKIYVLGGDNETNNTVLRLEEDGFTLLMDMHSIHEGESENE